jgi:hypothetical protein
MTAETSNIERAAEITQIPDKIMFVAGGGLIILGAAGLGWLLVGGAAVTYIPAEIVKRWAKKKRLNKNYFLQTNITFASG